MAAMEAPAGGDPATLKDAQVALFRAVQGGRSRRTTSAASTTATGRSTAWPQDSTTETYAALRLEIDNWRWAGVPFFIRTGKRLPVTQTELRLVFSHPPRLGFARPTADLEPNQLVVKLDPTTGIRLHVEAHRADEAGAEAIELDMEFAAGGRRGPDAVRGAAPRRDGRRQHALHPPGRRRGDLADHAAAARRAAARAPLRARAPGGRRRPSASSPATAAGTGPGCA